MRELFQIWLTKALPAIAGFITGVAVGAAIVWYVFL